MSRALDRRLPLAVGLLGGLLMVSAGLMLSYMSQLRNDAIGVVHLQEVLASLADLAAEVRDAELSQQPYLLSGDPRYLIDRVKVLKGIDEKAERFKLLTTGQLQQQIRISLLREQIVTTLDNLGSLALARKGKGFDAPRHAVVIESWKASTVSMHKLFREMEEDAQELLEQDDASVRRSYLIALVSGVASILLGLAAVASCLWLLRRHQSDLAKAAADKHSQVELLHNVLDQIDDGVITTDAEGMVTLVNLASQTLTGWAPPEAIGKHLAVVFRIIDATTRQGIDIPALQAMNWGRTVERASGTILFHREGREGSIENSAAPLRDGKGKVFGSVLVFRAAEERPASALK
jgi:PAS domain S-box-containing protein